MGTREQAHDPGRKYSRVRSSGFVYRKTFPLSFSLPVGFALHRHITLVHPIRELSQGLMSLHLNLPITEPNAFPLTTALTTPVTPNLEAIVP